MNERATAAPVDSRYFEDYTPGTIFDCGSITIDPAEIVAFALRYDPQYFHTDPEAAKRSAFGGLIASGWQTAGLAMRLLVEGYLSSVASLGSPGIDELRWTKPVRPGDILHVKVNVLDAKLSRTKPDRGIVRSLIEVSNQSGESVMSFKAINLLLCR